MSRSRVKAFLEEEQKHEMVLLYFVSFLVENFYCYVIGKGEKKTKREKESTHFSLLCLMMTAFCICVTSSVASCDTREI